MEDYGFLAGLPYIPYVFSQPPDTSIITTIVFQEDGPTLGVTLYISEPGAVRDYYGSAGYITLLHVTSGTRYALLLTPLPTETPDVPDDVYLAERSSAGIPLGEYRLEGSVADPAGNVSSLTGGFILKDRRILRWFEPRLKNRSQRYRLKNLSTRYELREDGKKVDIDNVRAFVGLDNWERHQVTAKTYGNDGITLDDTPVRFASATDVLLILRPKAVEGVTAETIEFRRVLSPGSFDGDDYGNLLVRYGEAPLTIGTQYQVRLIVFDEDNEDGFAVADYVENTQTPTIFVTAV